MSDIKLRDFLQHYEYKVGQKLGQNKLLVCICPGFCPKKNPWPEVWVELGSSLIENQNLKKNLRSNIAELLENCHFVDIFFWFLELIIIFSFVHME